MSRTRTRAARAATVAAVLATAALGGGAPPAAAADDGKASDGKGINLATEMNKSHYYFSLGVAFHPDYEGATDLDPDPFVIARWGRRGYFVELQGDTIRANLIPMSLMQAGPVFRYHRGRGDVSNDRVDRMRDVPDAFEAGVFFGPELRDPANPRRRLGLHVEALQDISGANDGYVVNMKLDGGTPLGGPWLIDVGVFSDYASGNYMQTYFGIDPDNAAHSGLHVFDAEAGFKDVGANATLTYQITDNWGVSLIARYKRLIGDAADSPLVSEIGTPNQFVGAMTVNYQF